MNDLMKCCIAAGTALVIGGLPYKMDVTHYSFPTRKVKKAKKIAVLADLHCRRFGREQSHIIEVIEKENPDLIIIPGDLFDYERDYEISFELIQKIKKYPVYFSSGNHDIYLKKDIGMLRARLESEGVHVLEDAGTVYQDGTDCIEIYGMMDHGRKPKFTSEEISHSFHRDGLRILISHRPEFVDFYGKVDCDMIISGHAHGGQWRIPGTHQGLYFPHVGFFPKYTEGVHDLHGRKLIISRGLASGHPLIPRLYNNPEIVIIDIQPM
jgi:predicted MPP superfamily phosphohydrolase